MEKTVDLSSWESGSILKAMITESLVTYIADERAKNVPDKDIKKALLERGWDSDDVTGALQGNAPASALSSLPDLMLESFLALKEKWRLFALLSLPWGLLSLVSAVYVGGMTFDNDTPISIFLGAVSLVLAQALLSVLATVSIIHALSDTTISDPLIAWKKGLSSFLRYLATSLASTVWILIGFLLLILPGFYFMVKVAFSGIVSILEVKSPIKAMNRSESLVQGRWGAVAWRFFGAIVLLMIVTIPVNGLSEYAIRMIPGTLIPLTLVTTVFGVFTSTLMTIYLYVLYAHLSGKKRG